MQVTLLSFGFKYGIPTEANYIWDVRFLINPYWVSELKSYTGQNKKVAAYVLDHHRSRDFLQLMEPMAMFLLKQNKEADKKEFTLAIGCTGGRHRSVAVTEHLKKYLLKQSVNLSTFHRDIEKDEI